MRMRHLGILALLAALPGRPAVADVPPGGAVRQLIVVPTGFENVPELRINTGRKAKLADGSFNTVYEKRTPSKGMVLLRFTTDVAVEGEPLVLRAQDLRLETGGEAPQAYAPVDWFQDLGLTEARGDSIAVTDRALLQFTMEVPEENVDRLTLVVASLRVGTVAEIRERIREQSGLK